MPAVGAAEVRVARVLIVEDDAVIAKAMATHLRHAGMQVEVSDRGDTAMKKLRFERPPSKVPGLMKIPTVTGISTRAIRLSNTGGM